MTGKINNLADFERLKNPGARTQSEVDGSSRGTKFNFVEACHEHWKKYRAAEVLGLFVDDISLSAATSKVTDTVKFMTKKKKAKGKEHDNRVEELRMEGPSIVEVMSQRMSAFADNTTAKKVKEVKEMREIGKNR